MPVYVMELKFHVVAKNKTEAQEKFDLFAKGDKVDLSRLAGISEPMRLHGATWKKEDLEAPHMIR